MCDICSDGESDRDCMFDKSLLTASGPGKQREMGLQVKKELTDFKTDVLLEFNDHSMTFGHLNGQFTK